MACLLGCCCCEKDDEPTSGKAPRPMSKSPMKKTVCCTDIIFLLIFIAFSGFMVYIGVFAFMEGAALRLIYGYDSFGNTCNNMNSNITNVRLSGQDTTGMRNVLYFDNLKPFRSVQLCVSMCPNETLRTMEDVRDFSLRTNSRLCYYNIHPTAYPTKNNAYSWKGPCPKLPVLKSTSVMNRCIPTSDVKNQTDAIVDQIDQADWVTKISHDIIETWKPMLILCFVALVISLILVLVMRFVAGIIVWLSIAISAIGSIVMMGGLWYTWHSIKTQNAESSTTVLQSDKTNETLFLLLAIATSLFTVILLLLIVVMRSRIALVVALFKEAGKCIAAMPTVLFQPAWTFIILVVWLVYSLGVLAFLSASGTAIDEDKSFNGSLGVSYNKTSEANVFWWFQLVGLVWIAEFILACQQMVIAGAVALWFFTRDKSGLSCCLVGKSTCRVILHHLGSVAFGSFIITLVKLPRLILMYIQKKATGVDNILTKFILKCCICCLWCLEKMLKFLNQNAYTIVVIEGKSFCPSAKKALSIIASNVLRVAAINSVGDFVLFLGKIAVTASTTAIAVFWLGQNEELHFWAVPVVFVAAFAFLIAHCFLSVYEMVIDTLLLCFCEDEDQNDGTEGHEYFMSTTLMTFVNNSDTALKNLKKRKRQEGQNMNPI